MGSPGSAQGQAEQGLKQPLIVENVPAYGRGVGSKLFLRSLPTPKILWFCNLQVSKGSATPQGAACCGPEHHEVCVLTPGQDLAIIQHPLWLTHVISWFTFPIIVFFQYWFHILWKNQNWGWRIFLADMQRLSINNTSINKWQII